MPKHCSRRRCWRDTDAPMLGAGPGRRSGTIAQPMPCPMARTVRRAFTTQPPLTPRSSSPQACSPNSPRPLSAGSASSPEPRRAPMRPGRWSWRPGSSRAISTALPSRSRCTRRYSTLSCWARAACFSRKVRSVAPRLSASPPCRSRRSCWRRGRKADSTGCGGGVSSIRPSSAPASPGRPPSPARGPSASSSRSRRSRAAAMATGPCWKAGGRRRFWPRAGSPSRPSSAFAG